MATVAAAVQSKVADSHLATPVDAGIAAHLGRARFVAAITLSVFVAGITRETPVRIGFDFIDEFVIRGFIFFVDESICIAISSCFLLSFVHFFL